MKKFALGFVVGLITSMVVGVFAANSDIFTAQRATFDIYVADEKFQSENPALVVEGRTYLPLRATGEALGIEVIWNGDLRRVEINKDNQMAKELIAICRSSPMLIEKRNQAKYSERSSKRKHRLRQRNWRRTVCNSYSIWPGLRSLRWRQNIYCNTRKRACAGKSRRRINGACNKRLL